MHKSVARFQHNWHTGKVVSETACEISFANYEDNLTIIKNINGGNE